MHLALVAIVVMHVGVALERREHRAIAEALTLYGASAWVAYLCYPNPGLVPTIATTLCPAAFTWGVCRTYGYESLVPVGLGIVQGVAVFAIGVAAPEFMPWGLVFAWVTCATLAWFVVVKRHRSRPSGITLSAALVCAASLVSDLPGVIRWAETGEYDTEQRMTALALTSLGILTILWKSGLWSRPAQA